MRAASAILVAAATASAAAPGGAQGAARGGAPPPGGRSGGQAGARQGAGPQRPDTGRATAFALDFQNQELQVVLSALAEAANLNVTMSNIPPQRVTVRMARGVPRDTLVAMVRGLAEANNVRFIAQGSLIRLEGDPGASPAAQQAAQQAAINVAQQQALQAAQLRLYTIRLKHASATAVAPVLMNLLGVGGVGGVPGAVTLLPGGGIQINTPGGAAGGAAGAAGRGGRGGGAAEIVTLPQAEIAVPGAAEGGAAGGAGGRGGRAGQIAAQQLFGGRGGAAAQALQTLLAQQAGGGTLSSAAAQVRIVAEESTNSLLIRASQPDFELIQQLVQGIDLRPLQVLIEVTIAEVQRSSDLNVGLGGTATRKGATNNAPRDTVGMLPGNASARDFIFQLTGGNGSINYRAALNALESRGNVKVLSLPVIIAQNNKQAMLNVGEQRPFVQVNQSVTTGTVPTTVQTVQYIPVGTTLTITPTINPDGYVNMAVDQTNDAATNEVQFSAPVISKRQATTQIFLRDGQTTVIGGLAGNNTSRTVSGVPWLSRIPLIGGLFFGNTAQTQTTNELFLFLTPHIISSDEDIEKFRNSLQGSSDLLKDVPVGPRIAPGDSARRPPPDTTRRRPPADTPAPVESARLRRDSAGEPGVPRRER